MVRIMIWQKFYFEFDRKLGSIYIQRHELCENINMLSEKLIFILLANLDHLQISYFMEGKLKTVPFQIHINMAG